MTLRELLYDYGGGTATGRPIRAVQVGGPLGAYLPEIAVRHAARLRSVCQRSARLLGHGGIVVFDDTVDMAQMARYAMEFCAIESCGKCTPCRIGSTRGVEVMDGILGGIGGHCGVGASADTGSRSPDSLALLDDLCETLLQTRCAASVAWHPFRFAARFSTFPRISRREPA